jgi:hypothetical protein
MAYYPQSRIITGLKSNPGEFILPNGKEYLGFYYITFDGKYFSGENPQTKNSIPLIKLMVKDEIINTKTIPSLNSKKYNQLNPNINIQTLQEPIPFIPTPTLEDYKLKKITRYFAKQRIIRIFKIIEINKETFDDINNRGGIYNYAGWDVISMFWTISDGNLPISFVEQQNRRIIDIKNKNFIGLKEYLTDLTKYSKL